jgi:hypothetical protein
MGNRLERTGKHSSFEGAHSAFEPDAELAFSFTCSRAWFASLFFG